MRIRNVASLCLMMLGVLGLAADASAQQPMPPPQQYPPPQYPPQQYPPPQYPPQQYPPQQYPPAQYPPQQYPPPQYPPQQYPPPGYPPGYAPPGYAPPPQPTPPPADTKRTGDEMFFLYGTSALWGVGSGIWLDSLAKVDDPGFAIIMPIAFGIAAPVGVYFWDNYSELDRGVPSSTATGLTLGALEGMGIAGVQWQYTQNGACPPCTSWAFHTETTFTWLFSTGGGVGGYFFGEWVKPDPRSLGFIASGAGWGLAAGTLFGAGVTKTHEDWKDGAAIAGLLGYNAGIVGAGALSLFWTPSWQTQKYMWLGWLAGTGVSMLVYPFYLFGNSQDWKHGLVANSLGGLAGVAVAGALTAHLTDTNGTAMFKPPFQLTIAPAPQLTSSMLAGTQTQYLPVGGQMLTAFGQF
ncbi:MAG: hypothetical protein ACRELY_04435 [Polyangiaceae bacterium]